MGSCLHSTVFAAAIRCSRIAFAASICFLALVVAAQTPETQEPEPAWVYWPDGARAITATDGHPPSTVQVASHVSCEGGFSGLYDMAGNVYEWLADCKGTYCKFRGGGYFTNEPVERFTGCGGACAGNQKPLQSGTVGIRCCRDGD